MMIVNPPNPPFFPPKKNNSFLRLRQIRPSTPSGASPLRKVPWDIRYIYIYLIIYIRYVTLHIWINMKMAWLYIYNTLYSYIYIYLYHRIYIYIHIHIIIITSYHGISWAITGYKLHGCLCCMYIYMYKPTI